MAPGVSPLDEALGLGGGRSRPQVLSWLARLGATVPFAQAAELLQELTGIRVSAATLRRQTEALGATAVALVEAEVEQLEQETPPPPAGPERLVLGVDGAMVPLVRGEWAEVKLLTLGEPRPCRAATGTEPTTASRTERLSYFARLTDAETFGRQALAELHRRGLETAGAVAAGQDGAVWLQSFVAFHRPDARRILDWPHAAQRLAAITEHLFGVQSPRSQRGADRLRRWLWTHGPPRGLAVLTAWESAAPAIAGDVAYLRERQAQLDYPTFRAQGWPVGSGATESGHKTVMQARLKRAGRRLRAPPRQSPPRAPAARMQRALAERGARPPERAPPPHAARALSGPAGAPSRATTAGGAVPCTPPAPRCPAALPFPPSLASLRSPLVRNKLTRTPITRPRSR